MKLVILWLFIAAGPCFALAQTKITRSFPVKKGQTVFLNFDYPKVVHISTWDGNEIAVVATVKINNGESDRAFTLLENTSEGRISISNKIDMDLIPDNYYIVVAGKKIRFTSQHDLETYLVAKGGPRPGINQQKNIDISIDIKIPSNVSTEVASLYGIVEVCDFNGPIKVDAEYGSVDASILEKEVGRVQLTTHYGKIYTNLSLHPTEEEEKDFFTSITAKPGHGPNYSFSSSYGNIYLRSSLK